MKNLQDGKTQTIQIIEEKMISFALQSGCSKSGKLFSPIMLKLNQLFSEFNLGGYDMHVVMRVSGSIWKHNFCGIQNLRQSKKRKRLTCDFGVPKVHWRGMKENDVKSKFTQEFFNSFNCVFSKLNIQEKEKITIVKNLKEIFQQL